MNMESMRRKTRNLRNSSWFQEISEKSSFSDFSIIFVSTSGFGYMKDVFRGGIGADKLRCRLSSLRSLLNWLSNNAERWVVKYYTYLLVGKIIRIYILFCLLLRIFQYFLKEEF